jgi:hypothetical protein
MKDDVPATADQKKRAMEILDYVAKKTEASSGLQN